MIDVAPACSTHAFASALADAVDGILIANLIFQAIDIIWIAAVRKNYVPSLQFMTDICGTGAICFDISRISNQFWVRSVCTVLLQVPLRRADSDHSTSVMCRTKTLCPLG